ncbi:MAG: hypothetical protein K8S13_02760 [Desulfobacula sp.]|uniref:hypothetical protein n=1 Tax=Desulfobacula sp. TaxID=2593537 RepID=UPI0025C44DB8|nr:hypothetical protein [Desulfobacula sp.]MCD4718766.1 hypothetical protein [Desulfobacula sp.]
MKKNALIITCFIALFVSVFTVNISQSIADCSCRYLGGSNRIGIEYIACTEGGGNDNTPYIYTEHGAIACSGTSFYKYPWPASREIDYITPAALINILKGTGNYRIFRNEDGTHILGISSWFNGEIDGVNVRDYDVGQVYTDVITCQYIFPPFDIEHCCHVSISAAKTNLLPGETVEINATSKGFEEEDIVWTISPDEDSEARATITVNDKGAIVYADSDSGNGTMTIRAENPNDSECFSEQIIEIGCDSCSGANCKVPGNGDPKLSSIALTMKLGSSSKDVSAGMLSLKSGTMTSTLSKPESLKFSTLSTDTKAIYINDIIRQIDAVETFVDIVVVADYKYRIDFYPPEAKGSLSGGVYTIENGSEPFVSWIIKNPDAAPDVYNQLKIVEKRGSLEKEYLYIFNDITDTWNLSRGAGFTMEELKTELSGNQTIKTSTMKDDLGFVSSVIKTTRENYPWGKEIIKEAQDPLGDNLVTTTQWYDDPAQTGSYKKKKSIRYPDGSWIAFTYDTEGKKLTQSVAFLDTVFGTPPESAKTVYYDYSPLTGDTQPLHYKYKPRTIIEKTKGIVTAKSFHVYSEDGSGEITELTEVCTNLSALFGDPDNLITERIMNPVNDTVAGSD